MISLRCDRGSSYKAYMSVQNELVAAYNELRDELAQESGRRLYGVGSRTQDAIREIYLRRFLRQNLKSTEKRSNGKI